MNWGTRIVIAFACFVAVIVSLVVISMRQNISLVDKDYYVQEIAYQEQIERINNKNELSQKPEINKENGKIIISIPDSELVGEVHFFRPSDAGLDKKYALKLDENGQQQFSAYDFEKGLWRVKVNWNKNGKEYYSEHSLTL
ncbi:MAG: FixH family protein [Fulvivirga sp.]